MQAKPNIRVLSFLRGFVNAASMIIAGIGLVVLLGWFLNVQILKSIIPNAATMKFNTALCFVLAGASLWFLQNVESRVKSKRIGLVLAGLVILIGLMTIGEYLFGWNFGIDQILIKDSATLPANFPGRMSQITAICFALSGFALLLVDTRASQYVSLSVVLLSLLAVIGYLFDYQSLYQLAGYGTIALHTALSFLFLSLAILAARPFHGMIKMTTSSLTGSRVVRFLIPFTIVFIILLGWLVEQGERLGFFNASNESVVLVVLLIFIYSPLIYLYAGRINLAEEQIIRLNRMYATLSQVNQTIVRVKSREELYHTVCNVVMQYGGFALAWIGILDETTGDVRPVASGGMDINDWQFPLVNIHEGPLANGLVSTAIRTGMVATSTDIQTDARTRILRTESRKVDFHSAAAIPFGLRNRIIGTFNLISHETDFFNAEEELRLLKEMGQDISFALDVMETEADHRQAEERFRLAIEAAPNGVILTNKKGQIILVNRRAEEYFLYNGNELAGLNIEALVPERLRTHHLGYRTGFLEKPQVRPMGAGRDLYGLRKDGSEFPVEIGLAPIETTEGMLVMATIVDIAKRKRAEEEVLRQINYLSALREVDKAITSSFDIQVTLNTLIDHTLSLLNVDAATILLIDPVTQLLTSATGQGFHTQVIQTARIKLGKSYAGTAAIEQRMVQIPNLADEPNNYFLTSFLKNERFVSYYGVPLIVKGNTIGVMEIFNRSIVTRNREWLDFLNTLARQAAIAIDNAQLWEQVQRHAVELEHRVAERTEELNQTNIELGRANRAKSEFLATMSHELRTPLNSILGLSESLLEQRRDPLTKHQQQSLQIVESSGRHLLELINDVLDLSKIEAGKFDYYPQIVDVDTLCRSSLAFVKEQAMRKGIELAYKEVNRVSKIYVDPRRVKQMLVNLLTNAVKFTPDHGKVDLRVYADKERDLIQLSVIDNGIGIAEDDLRQLFQPFIQVDSKLNRQFEGTGLGLSLVQKLADLHGGSVEVESEVGKGSRFTINLPWGKDIVAQEEFIEAGGELSANKPTEKPTIPTDDPTKHAVVLLAEDNMANILTVGEYLKGHGHEVLIAHDGFEVIQMAEESNPDIILMDIQMPAMDGLEATRRLRANSRFASTPIIALTALAMSGDRERCLEAGANEYMSKPVSLKLLVKNVETLLKARKDTPK